MVRVSKKIQTADGKLAFDGELSEEEYEQIFDFGLIALYKAGMIPFVAVEEEDISKVVKFSQELH